MFQVQGVHQIACSVSIRLWIGASGPCLAKARRAFKRLEVQTEPISGSLPRAPSHFLQTTTILGS